MPRSIRFALSKVVTTMDDDDDDDDSSIASELEGYWSDRVKVPRDDEYYVVLHFESLGR